VVVVLHASAADLPVNWVPKLGGWVNDTANVLSTVDRERLSEMLNDYHTETHHQIAVLIIDTLGGEAMEVFSLRTANVWRLGSKGIDDGIVVTVAMKERRTRIELGTGVARFISDADAKAIIDTDMVPAFAKGDIYGGLEKGLKTLMEEGRRFVVPDPKIGAMRRVVPDSANMNAPFCLSSAIVCESLVNWNSQLARAH
jgi:uncharacterized protein